MGDLSLGTAAKWARDRVPVAKSLLRRRWPLWVPPGHFYSPIPSPAEVAADARRIFAIPPEIPAVDLHTEDQLRLLDTLLPLAAEFPFPEHEQEGWRYHYCNTLYPYADGVMYYALLRHLRPQRVIEVGSGYSSVLALDTNERFLGCETRFTFIEPYPEVLHGLVGADAAAGLDLVERRVQDVEPAQFDALGSGDVLFVDSTHVAKTGSDVNFLLFDILPRLNEGVWVHFHDIDFPFEYRREWVDEGRAWNEAYALRAFLQFNDAFAIRLFNTYLEHIAPETFRSALPMAARYPGGSIWLERVGGAVTRRS